MRAAAIALMIAFAGHALGQDKKPADAKPPELVPDPTWIPKPGDQASVYAAEGSGAYAAKDMFAYTALAKAAKANDDVGIDDLVEKKRVVVVPHLTRLLVIERHTNPYTTGEIKAVEARFQDGPLKGQTAWVPEQNVERLITAAELEAINRAQGRASGRGTATDMTPKRKRKTFKADRPANQASNAFQAARKFDSEKKTKEAVDAYKAVVRDFPNSPEARMSAARIKILAGDK